MVTVTAPPSPPDLVDADDGDDGGHLGHRPQWRPCVVSSCACVGCGKRTCLRPTRTPLAHLGAAERRRRRAALADAWRAERDRLLEAGWTQDARGYLLPPAWAGPFPPWSA